MSATISEHRPQFHATKAARSGAEGILRSAESHLQIVCASESSPWEVVSLLQSDKTRPGEQCELEARRGGRTCGFLDSASEMNLNLCETIWYLRAQHDQEFADLGYERDSLHARLATYDSHSEASCESFRALCDRLEENRRASVSLLLRLELDLPSGPG